MAKWRVTRSPWSGTWFAMPDKTEVWFGVPYGVDAVGFPDWDSAFNFAFWEASRERQFHEVP